MTLKRFTRVPHVAVLAAGLLVCPTASAEGWSMPNLNPFAKKSKVPTSTRVSDSGSGFSLLPKWGTSTTKKRSSGPSTWSKMTNALNPWADDSKSQSRHEPSPTGSFNPFSTASTKKEEGKSWSLLPSWGSSEPEYKEPKSVNDFLKQEKLDY